MKGIVATICLGSIFLLVGLIGCEEAPKKTSTKAAVKTPSVKVKAKKTEAPTAKVKAKKPAEKPKVTPTKVEEKKPVKKSKAPAKVEEKKLAQAPKAEKKPAVTAKKETTVIKPAEVKEKKPPVPPKPILLPFNAKEKVWTIDDFEKGNKWKAETWTNANPATVTIAESGGGKELKVDYEAGEKEKSAISRSLPVDMASRSKLLVDVRSSAKKEIKLAIAFMTSAFFESKPVAIKPGLNKDVAFDLKTPTYKCAATEWTNTATLADANQVKTLYIVIYGEGAGEVSFDNIRLVAE